MFVKSEKKGLSNYDKKKYNDQGIGDRVLFADLVKDLEESCLSYSTCIDYVQNVCYSDDHNELEDSGFKIEMNLFNSQISAHKSLEDLVHYTKEKIITINRKKYEYQAINGFNTLKVVTEKLMKEKFIDNCEDSKINYFQKTHKSVKNPISKTSNLLYSLYDQAKIINMNNRMENTLTRIRSGSHLSLSLIVFVIIMTSVFYSTNSSAEVPTYQTMDLSDLMANNLTYNILHGHIGIERQSYDNMMRKLSI